MQGDTSGCTLQWLLSEECSTSTAASPLRPVWLMPSPTQRTSCVDAKATVSDPMPRPRTGEPSSPPATLETELWPSACKLWPRACSCPCAASEEATSPFKQGASDQVSDRLPPGGGGRRNGGSVRGRGKGAWGAVTADGAGGTLGCGMQAESRGLPAPRPLLACLGEPTPTFRLTGPASLCSALGKEVSVDEAPSEASVVLRQGPVSEAPHEVPEPLYELADCRAHIGDLTRDDEGTSKCRKAMDVGDVGEAFVCARPLPGSEAIGATMPSLSAVCLSSSLEAMPDARRTSTVAGGLDKAMRRSSEECARRAAMSSFHAGRTSRDAAAGLLLARPMNAPDAGKSSMSPSTFGAVPGDGNDTDLPKGCSPGGRATLRKCCTAGACSFRWTCDSNGLVGLAGRSARASDS